MKLKFLFFIEIIRLFLEDHDTSVAADATAVAGSEEPQDPRNHHDNADDAVGSDDSDDDDDDVTNLEFSIGTIFHGTDKTFQPFDAFKKRDWYEFPAERNKRKKTYFQNTLQQELNECDFTLKIFCRGKPEGEKILLEVSKSVPFETQLRRWEELVKTEQRYTLLIRNDERRISEEREALYEKLKRK
jgi:hypothetical protein